MFYLFWPLPEQLRPSGSHVKLHFQFTLTVSCIFINFPFFIIKPLSLFFLFLCNFFSYTFLFIVFLLSILFTEYKAGWFWGVYWTSVWHDRKLNFIFYFFQKPTREISSRRNIFLLCMLYKKIYKLNIKENRISNYKLILILLKSKDFDNGASKNLNNGTRILFQIM